MGDEQGAVLPPGVVADLRAIVGDDHVLVGRDLTAGYAVDWTGRFAGATPAVVRPGSTEEVAAVVQRCGRDRVAVVPQGGNTGLVGGGVPLRGEVVLSLRRLDALEPVDLDAMQLVAGAGVTITRLQEHAAQAGAAYGVDLAARDSATVGGTIATNAGGMHVLRWGGTRRQVAGIEAVLGDGTVVSHLRGLDKDNTGYDLAGLLCGSEGTLGIVTRARLRLVPRYEQVVVALAAFDDVTAAVSATAAWRRQIGCIDAAEMMLDDGVSLVCEVEGVARPFAHAHRCYVLVEAADHRDPTDALAAAIGERPDVRDVAVSTDDRSRCALWAYREGHTTAINTLGPPHKLDVTLPLRELAAFVDEVPGAVASVAPSAKVWLFGHIGDGNVHVNVSGVEPDDDRVDDVVLRLVAAKGGSISAEHGIGTAKRRWLTLNRTPSEIAAFRAIKRALDPLGILNPNVLLEEA